MIYPIGVRLSPDPSCGLGKLTRKDVIVRVEPGAELSEADLIKANLSGAKYKHTQLNRAVNVADAIL